MQMNSSFDQRVERMEGACWLKDVFTPDETRAAGLLSYAGAEFEFPTCPALRRGIAEAAAHGSFGYMLPRGKYLERVQWWMKHVRGYEIDPEWVVATHGTIFALATAIRLLSVPGDSIIILTPGYNRYEQAATRLGRGTVHVPLTEMNGCYQMDWTALEQAMSAPENRLLVLCNPNNPTGHIYRREELERIAGLSQKYGTAVFSDEIFAEIVFDGGQVTPYAAVAGKAALAITCTSLGKAFSLTGVNHANVIIENDALRERYVTQRNADHYGSIDPMHCAALTAAYTPEGKAWLDELCAYVWENYRILAGFIKKCLPEAVVTEPEGTYVVWIDYGRTGMSGEELQRRLIREGCFAGDAGDEYYGRDTCMRYSLAVPRQELLRSLAYLEAVLDRAALE